MEPVIYLGIGFIIGGVIAWLFAKSILAKNHINRLQYDEVNNQFISLKTSYELLQKNMEQLKIELIELKSQLQLKTSDQTKSEIQIAELKSVNNQLKEKEETLTKKMNEIGEQFTNQFKVLANEILEDKSKKFTEQNQTNIKQLLDPLGLDIKSFKQKVEEVYINESKERFSLKNEIGKLYDLNQKLSDDAKNLTKALKGDSKTQGDWGEMILENILEKSGLTNGREYFKQETYRDHDDNLLKPDFVIALPDNRKIVIDAKVSLTAYEKFTSTDDPEEQKKYLKQHLSSVYAHVDTLSKKNYQDLIGTGSLDFVLMFVPIESANYAASYEDPNLWQYAYQKGIVIVSPSSLLSAMKLIADLWKRDKQSKHAVEIAERSGMLYDKFASFIDTLRDIGMHINKSQDKYKEAVNQLTDGRGNIISQFEKMKELGAKAKKDLPEKLLDKAALDELTD